MGVGALAFFNCADSHETIHIWLNDQTAGTGWVEQGVLDSQFDSTGTCPASGQPFLVRLSSGHLYLAATVDPTKCGGQNDPTNIECQRTITTAEGQTNGPTVSVVVT